MLILSSCVLDTNVYPIFSRDSGLIIIREFKVSYNNWVPEKQHSRDRWWTATVDLKRRRFLVWWHTGVVLFLHRKWIQQFNSQSRAFTVCSLVVNLLLLLEIIWWFRQLPTQRENFPYFVIFRFQSAVCKKDLFVLSMKYCTVSKVENAPSPSQSLASGNVNLPSCCYYPLMLFFC